MPFHGSFAICFTDIIGGGVSADAEQVVQIFVHAEEEVKFPSVIYFFLQLSFLFDSHRTGEEESVDGVIPR